MCVYICVLSLRQDREMSADYIERIHLRRVLVKGYKFLFSKQWRTIAKKLQREWHILCFYLCFRKSNLDIEYPVVNIWEALIRTARTWLESCSNSLREKLWVVYEHEETVMNLRTNLPLNVIRLHVCINVGGSKRKNWGFKVSLSQWEKYNVNNVFTY